jgi:hypothetical protein
LSFNGLRKEKSGPGAPGGTAPAPLFLLDLAHLVHVRAGKRQQGDLAGLFHGTGDDALMFGACTGLATRADVAFISYVFSEKVSLFIVNNQCFICTELAEFGLGKEAAFATPLLSFV